jgi:hypothetical protein
MLATWMESGEVRGDLPVDLLIGQFLGRTEQSVAELFDVVVGRALASFADTVPFTPDGLPGYAGARFDLLQ